jgi:hypothetical protein
MVSVHLVQHRWALLTTQRVHKYTGSNDAARFVHAAMCKCSSCTYVCVCVCECMCVCVCVRARCHVQGLLLYECVCVSACVRVCVRVCRCHAQVLLVFV